MTRQVARAALLIAGITVTARAVGFLRTVVFARVAGSTCLASTYLTANSVPNLIFEVVAGGALAAVVVPLLAGPVARGDTRLRDRTTSALLTWTVLVLGAVSVLGALLARPILGALVGSPPPPCARDEMVDVGARMLLVFAPQVVLYGIGIVLTGALQVHHRFVGPALAPLLSSLVVILAYLAFAALAPVGALDHLAALPPGAELVLSVGTTLGVVALSLSLLAPLRATGVRLRATLTFPSGLAPRARRLAVAGVGTLVAQQASLAVVLRLANSAGPKGAVALYTFAWSVFLLLWAVLAVPLATSAFPSLAAAANAGDESGYAETAASTTRLVLLASLAGTAVLVATAAAVARVLVLAAPGRPDPATLAAALVAFAPGLVGYGLVASVGRALNARHAGWAAATATVTGWLTVIGTDLLLVPSVPRSARVAALAVGNSVGMTVAGCLLLLALRAHAGRAALAGVAGALARGSLAAALAAGAGLLAGAPFAGAGVVGSVGASVGVAVVAVTAFLVVLVLLPGASVRADRVALLAFLRRP